MSRDVPPVIPLTELTSTDAANELMTRIRAATRAVTPYGGWPPLAMLQQVVAEWLADFGLHIDDEPPEKAIPEQPQPADAVRDRLAGYLDRTRAADDG